MDQSRELPATGEEWRAARLRRRLTVAALARRTSLDPSTIWALEHDRAVARRTRLLVAAALELDPFPPIWTPVAA